MRKILFDTSVLTASLVSGHPDHASCWSWFRSVVDGANKGYLSALALPELYSTLTGVPLRPAPSPSEVIQVLEASVLPHFQVIPLDQPQLGRALALASRTGTCGSALFDALTVVAGQIVRVEHVLTLNFERLRPLCPDGPWLLDPRLHTIGPGPNHP